MLTENSEKIQLCSYCSEQLEPKQLGVPLYEKFSEEQIKSYAVEGAIGKTSHRMDDFIKTQQDKERPSEDFIMFRTVVIMPVHSYICDSIYLRAIPLGSQHYNKTRPV